MKLYVWETEKHMQVNEFHVDSIEDFRVFWRDLQDKYMGFKIDFCYKKRPVPVDLMLEINAEILESCIETRLAKENFKPVYEYELTLVTKENFAEFAALHDKAHPETSGMYWTSERINKDLSSWLIYMYENNYILAKIRDDELEFYAVEATERRIGETLISKVAEYALKVGKSSILAMVEDGASEELAMYLSVGFVPCGKYIAYQTVIE